MEGIVGLTMSFTMSFAMAGSQAVLCSLWKIDDQATQALMVKFYEPWNPKSGKGISAAAVLTQADEHVRSQKGWEYPSCWAAWVLWGRASRADLPQRTRPVPIIPPSRAARAE